MYQTMSPDNLPSSSIRKSNHFKSNKEDQNNNNNNNCGNNTSSQQQQQQQQNEQQQNNNSIQIHESSPSLTQCLGAGAGAGNNSSGGDMLLQWGQRKRSRCSRMEKNQTANQITPPHPTCKNNNNGFKTGSSSRVRPNGVHYVKDGPGFLPTKNRNLTDQMGCSSSASPSRNGNSASRAISRSGIGKRSPTNDKKVSGSGSISRVKSDDSLPHTGNPNHTDSPHVEQDNNNIVVARCPVVEAEKDSGQVVELPRIFLSLSRKEKEEDFYAMKGTKLPHRPKKRAKAVDRALQYCFPGLWLSDLTRARYEVRERKSTKKPKRRGLKGLDISMDSESE